MNTDQLRHHINTALTEIHEARKQLDDGARELRHWLGQARQCLIAVDVATEPVREQATTNASG